MANRKEIELRKLKKQYFGGSLIGFIVVGFVIFCAFAAMLAIFGLYITDTKVRDEHSRVMNMAQLYKRADGAGNGDLSGMLDDPDHDYIIVDDNNNIIREHGTNTCDLEKGGLIDILGDDEADIGSLFAVYPDKSSNIIKPGPHGRVEIDHASLIRSINEVRGNAPAMALLGDDFLSVPFWIGVPAGDGIQMVAKAHFVIYFRELAILAMISAVIVALTILMLFFIIVYICKTIRNKKRMERVFFMDEVTGNNNWLWFLKNAEDMLKKKKNRENNYAVLDIVFVNYRTFCVCHSVREGERMLCEVDRVIRENTDKRKELSAHHSAAHFAALLTYSEMNSLEVRIWEIIRKLEKINDEHKFSFWVGVDRIGSIDDHDGKNGGRPAIDIEKEYNNAGAARATITTDDSAIAFFDSKMIEEQRWMDTVNENQQKALDNEEFVVYYQPKYDPSSHRLKGAEALVRWISPQHGTISPGRFIPIFENNGFITKLDHYMLKHVAQDQRRWLDKGCDCVPVSVNVSRAHFIESDLADQIRDIVDEAGTPHELIEIELTESAFFDDKKALIHTLGKLKEYGFAVSMDDFGSGYSSLNSLKEMPLDVLKLDADFFRNDDGNDRGRIVVAEAIRLAKNLDMKTVAEGVEIKEQVDFLAEQGCDMIQGYYFAKPMPKDEYEQKMDEKYSTVF